MPSVRNPASIDIISAFVLLWSTAVCLFFAHEIGSVVIDLTKCFIVKSKSGLPILAKYKHFNTN